MADDKITVQLTGDKDIVAAFNDLRDYLPRNALRTSLKTAANILWNAIERYVPVLTGKLARNISVSTQQSGDFVRARVSVSKIGKADNPLNAFYWRFLERGWHDRGGTAHIEPFVAPAMAAHEVEAAQAVIDSVDAAIDRAEAKANG